MYYKYGKDDFVVETKSYPYNPQTRDFAMNRDQEALKRAVMLVRNRVIDLYLHEIEFKKFRKFTAGAEMRIEFFGKPVGVVRNPMRKGMSLKVFVNSKISFYFHIKSGKVLNLGFAE